MIFFRRQNKKPKKPVSKPIQSSPQSAINPQVSDNIAEIKKIFNETPDLVIRQFIIKQTQSSAALVYLSGLTDKKAIHNHVLTPLLFEINHENKNQDPAVSLGHVETTSEWSKIESSILEGNSVLFIAEKTEAFIFSTQGFPQRAIEDSQIEPSLRGAHQGFTESSGQNIALVRRHIPNRELKIKEMTVGRRGKTKISILYLADVAEPDVLKELEDRINQLNVDSVLNTGMLAEFIEDNPYSPFPQLMLTERPDTAALHLLEGRYVTVVDKSPSVLIVPAAFVNFFESIDDYGTRWGVASFIRFLRYVAFFIAIFLPSIYIAVITFHAEIIPIKLLISIGLSRERVPFPPIIEAFIMELTLEMLREAGVRLPSPIGQTVGIVGGIVIGQAAVEAGIVSNIMVIVVALTAIASFIIPNYDMGAAIRILRFPMMILAAVFGFLGLAIGFMVIIGDFIALESMGTPYGSPLAPLRFSDLKDALIRFPAWSFVKRSETSRAVQLKKAETDHPKGDSH
ncbi:spore germination protein [Bacillus oleivorans]|uniref:Spore germination protein n=1 Tax=Bacillus oleivorans TaxID=1448271 RepID=A0A285CS74_9BACI|nr:spore germination protein [Bacillus oleivorans]SNX70344.1 spore germination protein [Bacillus oleivorans]